MLQACATHDVDRKSFCSAGSPRLEVVRNWCMATEMDPLTSSCAHSFWGLLARPLLRRMDRSVCMGAGDCRSGPCASPRFMKPHSR